MIRALSLSELVAPLQATLVGTDCEFSRVCTDSRQLQAGDLFVALRGENFDGHDYLEDIASTGAVAALVDQAGELSVPTLQVADTLKALGQLAGYHRQLYSGPLVAITGSSGKTTVKNMIAAVLSRRGKTLATQGNFNNEIGAPLTLLQLEADTEFAVVEMGAARSGDIAWLCEVGRPTVSVLLNAMAAHLQGFGSVNDVAAAKGEIYDGLAKGDVAIINADQPWAGDWRKRAGEATVLDYGLEKPAAISATAMRSRGVEGISFIALTPAGDAPIRLHLPGVHNVTNALAAIAVGLACELTLTEIREGLEAVRAVSGRLSVSQSADGATVIDDCYNANPGSVRAAIDMLATCEGRRTLVLGAMLELGETSKALHRQIGEYAREAGIDRFWGVGPELEETVSAFGAQGQFFVDREAAIAALPGEFGERDTVLIKGSRSTRMEQFMQALLTSSQRGKN
jgi:UDP-N-acetylmuramoyl-tripeptide--D-alanyl-D-alanine ligase